MINHSMNFHRTRASRVDRTELVRSSSGALKDFEIFLPVAQGPGRISTLVPPPWSLQDILPCSHSCPPGRGHRV